jgi:hypothetical protein
VGPSSRASCISASATSHAAIHRDPHGSDRGRACASFFALWSAGFRHVGGGHRVAFVLYRGAAAAGSAARDHANLAAGADAFHFGVGDSAKSALSTESPGSTASASVAASPVWPRDDPPPRPSRRPRVCAKCGSGFSTPIGIVYRVCPFVGPGFVDPGELGVAGDRRGRTFRAHRPPAPQHRPVPNFTISIRLGVNITASDPCREGRRVFGARESGRITVAQRSAFATSRFSASGAAGSVARL